VNDLIVPLGLGLPVEDEEGPPKGNWGSVGTKPGRKCPKEEGPLGEIDGVGAGVGIESFNVWYPGGNVGVTLGVHGVLIEAILTVVNQVRTIEVAVRWDISTRMVKW
jgi:hypothetical protein